jgi:hypothetical protein
MENSAKKTKISTRMILSTAALLAIQAMPSQTYAQAGNQQKSMQKIDASSSSIFIKIKDAGEKVSIVGFENGTPVYKNRKGEFYTVNGKTGDLNFIKPEEFAKFYCCIKISNVVKRDGASGLATGKRLAHIKMESEITNVTVVGVDKSGNSIQTNSRGETFTLDPVTGDMIFVK